MAFLIDRQPAIGARVWVPNCPERYSPERPATFTGVEDGLPCVLVDGAEREIVLEWGELTPAE